MRWFDYCWCLLFADFISAGLISYNTFLVTIGLLGYLVYERIRVYTSKKLD